LSLNERDASTSLTKNLEEDEGLALQGTKPVPPVSLENEFKGKTIQDFLDDQDLAMKGETRRQPDVFDSIIERNRLARLESPDVSRRPRDQL